jgi:hypothetical protein
MSQHTKPNELDLSQHYKYTIIIGNELVKQALKIEMRKLQDHFAKEQVARVMIARIEREERAERRISCSVLFGADRFSFFSSLYFSINVHKSGGEKMRMRWIDIRYKKQAGWVF